MRTGTAISAAGHATVIALALFGMPWLSKPDTPPIRVTDVSFVSEEDFEAAQAAAEEAERIPDAPPARPAPSQPEVLPEPVPPPMAERPAPEPAPEPAPDPAEVASLAPSFNADAPLTQAPDGVTLAPPAPLSAVTPPRPRPVERVMAEAPSEPEPAPPAAEPAPVVEPEPEPAPAPQVEPAPVVEAPPAPAGQVAAAAPPRARPAALDRPVAPERVAAAEPEPERPEPQRPARPAAERPATPRPEPQRPATPRPQATPATPATRPSTTPATPASPASGSPATSLPVGPPMTGAEKEGLKLAVQRCWNVPAGLRDAQQLKVTLGAELTAQGEIIASSIRLVEPSSPPDGRFQQAYEAGRRALLRCGPYTLPREKYAQWRNIEVVFNPEGMVSW
jgi:hypothetical protein